jgi:hypothetical protein
MLGAINGRKLDTVPVYEPDDSAAEGERAVGNPPAIDRPAWLARAVTPVRGSIVFQFVLLALAWGASFLADQDR